MELLQQSFNALKGELYLRDHYITLIEIFSQTKNITTLTGQRRTGKSFLILGFLKKHNITIKNCFYLNKEFDIANRIQTSKDLKNLFEEYTSKYGDPEYLIIDEIQDIQDWEYFVRGMYASKKYKIIITGSNAKLLSSELTTFLTGRFLSFEVVSFTYHEFLEFTHQEQGKESFQQYVQRGGLPEVLLQQNESLKRHYLGNTVSTMLYQDIIKRYGVKNEVLAEKILKFLANNIGNLTSLRNIEKYMIAEKLKISVATISKYVSYLEHAYLIKKVERIGLKGKEYFKFIGKYYFSDIGMRNSIIGAEYTNLPQLLENVVYHHLLYLGYEVYIGTLGEKEIDFVAVKDGEKKYFQVCYLLDKEDTREREFGNLLEIDDNFDKFVISYDELGNFSYQGIKWMNIITFLTSFR